ncbi:MAG: hypothetical protein ACPGRC_10695 [Salibacteraceae bacterium]
MKKFLIFLTYGFVILQLSIEDKPTVFVFMFTLWIELVFMILFYGLVNIFSKEKSTVNLQNVFIGAVPLLIFNYVIIYFGAVIMDDFTEIYGNSEHGIIYPVIVHQKQLLLLLPGLLIGYFLAFWEIKKSKTKLIETQQTVIYLAFSIWIMGAITMLVMSNVPEKYFGTVVFIFPISRMILEETLDRKLKGNRRSKKNENPLG